MSHSHSSTRCLATMTITPRKTRPLSWSGVVPFPSSHNSSLPGQHIGEKPNLTPVVRTAIPITWSLVNCQVQLRCSQRRCWDPDGDVIHVRLAKYHYGTPLGSSVKLLHHPCFPVGTTDLRTALYICHWCWWRCFSRYEGAENDVECQDIDVSWEEPGGRPFTNGQEKQNRQ